MCDVFATRFADTFSPDDIDNVKMGAALRNIPTDPLIPNRPSVDVSTILKAIDRLKPSFSPGPDGIPPTVVKRCAVSLAPILVAIFRESLRIGEYPASWKTSWLVPVYKKGDKSNAANYRGITSLCAFAKAFELVVYEPLRAAASNYLSNAQHGFVPKRSTTTNLIEFVSFCHKIIDSGQQVDAVYTDIKAAFDSVPQSLLLAKLHALDLPASMLNWMRSYLCGRTYRVKLAQIISRPICATSGVPQGSNLRPLLFVIYVNDVTHVLPPDLLLYADDAKLFLPIANPTDQLRLQAILNVFQTWCDANGLMLSTDKCTVITFARKRSP